MAVAIGNGAAAELGIDPTPKAARVILYDAAGNIIAPANRAAVVDTVGGILQSGKDYKISRVIRSSPDGTLRTSDDTLLLYDSVEGAAFDSNKWIQTLTTMTVTQATGSILFNAGASSATPAGAMHVSHRQFPFIHRNALAFRTRVLTTAHFANNQIQLGFGIPTSVSAVAFLNGAAWRKDGTGQWLPVISINGAETLGTPISDATFRAAVPATDYAIFSVFLEETRATFQIQTSLGVIVNAQVIDFTAASPSFAATHLSAMHHICNTGATGTAVQMRVSGTAVFACDGLSQVPFEAIQAGMQYDGLTSPTTYVQIAQWANSADPAAAALSNTVPSYTALGGKFIGPTPTPGAAVTDFALFAFTIPAPYQFYCTGISIFCVNRGAAIATSATILEWGVAFNASSGSLASAAPYTPMRKTLGLMQWPIAAAIDSMPNPPQIQEVFGNPQVVQPGRTIIIILRVVQGTATAAGFLRGNVKIDGYFV